MDVSFLLSRGIVNGRKSGCSFDTVDEGGLRGQIDSGVTFGFTTDEVLLDFDFLLEPSQHKRNRIDHKARRSLPVGFAGCSSTGSGSGGLTSIGTDGSLHSG